MNWLNLLNLGLSVVFGLMILLFIIRIVLTWYPQTKLKEFPFNIVAIPTEPILATTRKVIPPLGGVDITPVLWVGIMSLVREMLLGQQGILTMMAYLK